MQKKRRVFGTALLLLLICVIGTLLIYNLKEKSTSPQENDTSRLLVLMYHHLTKKPEKVGPYTISVDDFETDLQYLKEEGYETITPSQLLDHIDHQTPLPKRPVMITFDDGYESVYAYAYPLLKQYQMNACCTIVGEYTDLYTKSNDHNLDYSYMTWQEVKELQESGVIEIGNHTDHLHVINETRQGCCINPSESIETYHNFLKEDVGHLQDQIQSQTGVRPVAFAYPFGKYCKESYDTLSSLGIRVTFSCDEQWNAISDHVDSLLMLGRFNRSGGVPTETFFRRIS